MLSGAHLRAVGPHLAMKKRVMLVAATTGYQTRSFQQAAGRAGISLAMATDRCHVLDDPWGDHALPIRFDDSAGAAEAAMVAGELDGIVAVGDRAAITAAHIAKTRALRFSAPDAVAAAGNKYLAHERFRASGLLVTEYYRVPVEDAPDDARFYPCVLKPLGMSASRGVIRADNSREFRVAFARITELIHDTQGTEPFIQIERYIPGREFALEGLLTSGALRTLAIFDKPDPLEGPYFEETIYITPSRETAAVQRAIGETAQRATRALGLSDGPVHAEMRVNEQGVWMLEVAARPIGGLCAQALPGLEELILHHAAGDPLPSEPLLRSASGVMMIPIPAAGVYVGVDGVDHARAVDCITDVAITAKEGQRLVPLPEGNSYLGFIFARAEDPAEVDRALRESHARLRFAISAALPVLR